MYTAEQFDSLVAHFLEIVKSPESEWTTTSEKRGVKVSQKADPNSSLLVLRGYGKIKASAETIADLLTDINKRASWDVFFETGTMVKWIKENELGIAHLKFKGYGWTVWPRDFVVAAGKKKLENGSYVCAATSIENPDIPEVSGLVRAKIVESGFLIEPAEDGYCNVTYILQVDLAGWIPTTVTNMVNQYQPLGIIGIRKVLTGKSDP